MGADGNTAVISGKEKRVTVPGLSPCFSGILTLLKTLAKSAPIAGTFPDSAALHPGYGRDPGQTAESSWIPLRSIQATGAVLLVG
jgi:hypothetical protein